METRQLKQGVFVGVALLLALGGLPQVAQAEEASQGQASGGWPVGLDIHPGLTQAIQAAQQGRGGVMRAPVEKNLSLVGFTNLGRLFCDPACTSDVWAHRNFAYVGTFIDFSGTQVGVQVVDISDPSNPQVVNMLPTPLPFTGANDVKVATINTKFFHGDLLVMSNEQRLGGQGAVGIQLWDVTDPLNAVELSRLPIGPVHNTFLYQKGNRAFVLLAIPLAEVFSGPDPFSPAFGDFVVVEVTDPTNPVVIADWGAGKDGGLPFGFGPVPFPVPITCLDPSICRGAAPLVFLHDVWVNRQGTIAYLSYWDLGLILLDISNPANPTFIGRGIAPAPMFGNDDGDLHAAVPAQGGNLVVVGDEDFNPLPWGFLRVFDTLDPTNPVQVGSLATSNALNNPDISLTFSMHNIFVRGSKAYLSWYDDGIRVVDVSQPSHPREVAAFLPPAGTGPGLFWGVYVHKDLVLGSDLLSGLFILKQKPEK